MAGSDQWYFTCMGLTKFVQPYCMFATAIMQMRPMASCVQGLAKGERSSDFGSVTIARPLLLTGRFGSVAASEDQQARQACASSRGGQPRGVNRRVLACP